MRVLVVLAIVLFSTEILGQVGINTTTPESSSILDISSTDKGILIPRVSLSNVTDTMIDGVNPAATGLLIYNTNTDVIDGSGEGYYYFNGAQWERLVSYAEAVDADWYKAATTINPDSISNNIYTQGKVAIGKTNPEFKFEIQDTSTTDSIVFKLQTSKATTAKSSIYQNEIAYTGTDTLQITHNYLTGNSGGVIIGKTQTFDFSGGFPTQIGSRNVFSGPVNRVTGITNEIDITSGIAYGIENTFTGSSGGAWYGVRNKFIGGSASRYGVYNEFTGSSFWDFLTVNYLLKEGGGASYAVYNKIDNTGDGYIVGAFNDLDSTGNNIVIGTHNQISGIASGTNNFRYGTMNEFRDNNYSDLGNYGVYNSFFNFFNPTGPQTGVYNQIYVQDDSDNIGFHNYIWLTGNGEHIGLKNEMASNTNNNLFGVENDIYGEGDGDKFGVSTVISSDFSADGDHYGVYNLITSGGPGLKYGSFNKIGSTAGGNHYGVYSEVQKVGQFSGYFIGNFMIDVDTDQTNTNGLLYVDVDNTNVGIGTESPSYKLDINGTLRATQVNFSGLPTYPDDASAGAGGLIAGDLYKTATGELRIKN